MEKYRSQVRHLEEILAERLDPTQRSAAISAQLGHIASENDTLSVTLFDLAGNQIGGQGSATEPDLIDPEKLARIVATRRASVQAESDSGEDSEDVYDYLLPVASPEGPLVLEVDQRADIVTKLIADLRLRKALGLLIGMLLAVPLSYLLGGRTLHRRQIRAARDADTDALTGLAGRRPFRPMLEAALANQLDVPVVLALIDLDGFKQINDRLGHSYGDRVLVSLAESFGVLRSTDEAFRLGGDEFAIVLLGGDDDSASAIVNRVRTSLAALAPGVTFSCGIASRPPGESTDMQELWERSDAAMYEAKHRGRDRTVTFGKMTTRHTVSAEKLDAMTVLLDDDSPITVVFQPIWDLRLGVVLAHEALLRLPTGCPIDGPQEAFELAQRLGLAAALDSRARRAVLTSISEHTWEGLLFLNVHPDALRDLDVDALVEDLVAAGLEPADVVLEVTEQTGLDHPEPIRVLKRAHSRGFRLALDDMGQSNAGLRALTHVRFDVLKLDRRVVAGLGADPASAATMAAAIAFVQQTGGWVIAEGIEDYRMLEALLGDANTATTEPVLAGQGYLLGRPDPQPVEMSCRLPLLERQPPLIDAEN